MTEKEITVESARRLKWDDLDSVSPSLVYHFQGPYHAPIYPSVKVEKLFTFGKFYHSPVLFVRKPSKESGKSNP